VSDADLAEPRDCAGADAGATCKEDLIQLPVAMWLLSERQRMTAEEAAQGDDLEARLKQSLNALQSRAAERVAGSILEFGTYVIDYAYLKELRRDILTLTPTRADESAADTVAQLAAYGSRIADRVIFVGDLKDTSDHLCYTPGMTPLPGVLIHACSLATLNRGMFLEATDTLGRRTVLGAGLFLVALIVLLRAVHTRSPLLRAWPFQYVEIVVFGFLSIALFLSFRWQLRANGAVWPHFLWVSGALFLYPFAESVYRAVAAVPGMLRATALTFAGRARGG
jgi:hypothetical protein